MFLRSLALVALLAARPVAAADTLTEDFFDFLEDTCLPAIENVEVPDLSAMTPYDRDNPDHHFLGSTLGDAYVHDDPRLLIAIGERNGFRGCEVSYAPETVTEDGAAIVDALEIWIHDHIDRTTYSLVDNCVLPGFKFFVVAGSEGRNPRGHFVRILAYGAVGHDDEERYGHPRALIAETPESSAEQCITEDGAPPP